MPYRRSGRPTYYFMGVTESGRKQLSAGTPNRALASKVESMWKDIGTAHRAWDLLAPVLDGRVPVGSLYDAWLGGRFSIEETRRRLHDIDLVPLVTEWESVQRKHVKPDSANHAIAHVRHFFPADSVVLASSVTTDFLTKLLHQYPGKRNTLRKVHSSLSVFLRYCTVVKCAFQSNPAERVSLRISAKPITHFGPKRSVVSLQGDQ